MLCQTRVQEFFDFYQRLDKNCTKDLANFYDSEIVFTDSLHEIRGLNPLIAYFDRLYARVDSLGFEFSEPDIFADRCWCSWQMTFRHPRLRRGQAIQVQGASRLDWREDKVVRHRDFFDAGQMLYEQVPLLGTGIRLLKRRLQA